MGGSNSNTVVSKTQLENLLIGQNSTQLGGSKNITSDSHLEYQSVDISSEFRKLGDEIHELSVSEKKNMVGGYINDSSSSISSSSNLSSSSSSEISSSEDPTLISTSFIVLPEEVIAREVSSDMNTDSDSSTDSDNNKQNFINSSEPILMRANKKMKHSKAKKSKKSKAKKSKKSKTKKSVKPKRMYITENSTENGLLTSSSAVNYKTYSETSNMDIKPFSSTQSDVLSLSKIDRRRN